jgi:glutamate N-acetyltransferase/amino-acid N-acetyltransferase
VTRKHLRDGTAQAIVVVSGIANDCTGEQGTQDAIEMAARSAEALGLQQRDVLVAATGVIGVFLPMDRVSWGIARAAKDLSRTGGGVAARAIMTTDTKPKSASAVVRLGSQAVRLWGMAKGSGMIHPQLATMLGFVLTDAAVCPKTLKEALRRAVRTTFNRITVDGDMSPSDTVMLLANGAAGNRRVGSLESPSGKAFAKGLEKVCASLAQQIAADGEGATRLVRIRVSGAVDEPEAERIARGIATSCLVKTAIAGGDPNWGRIVSSVGQYARKMDPESAEVFLGPIKVYARRVPAEFDPRKAEEVMAKSEVDIHVRFRDGKADVTYLTCDLTYDYVRINSEYHT